MSTPVLSGISGISGIVSSGIDSSIKIDSPSLESLIIDTLEIRINKPRIIAKTHVLLSRKSVVFWTPPICCWVPPSVDDLRERLIKRGSETNKSIEKRLERFNKEMDCKDRFDTLLINDNIQVAINDFIMIINELTKGNK